MCAPYLNGDRDTREQGAVPVQLRQHLPHEHAHHHLLAATGLDVDHLRAGAGAGAGAAAGAAGDGVGGEGWAEEREAGRVEVKS